MNTLPQLNFMFFMLLLPPLLGSFERLNVHISKFIWSGQQARISFTTLQCTKTDGALALANLSHFYWAFWLKSSRIWVAWRQIKASRVTSYRL